MEIKCWNKKVFSSNKSMRQKFIAEIEELDQWDDEGNLQYDKRVKRVDLLSQLRSIEKREVAMPKRKASVEWLNSGDTNSKFYPSTLRRRRAKNDIVGVRINGVWCEESSSVKIQVESYFESRFDAKPRLKMNLDGVGFKTIYVANNELL